MKNGTVKVKGKKFTKIKEIYQNSISTGIDLRSAVICPKGENENSWLAFNGKKKNIIIPKKKNKELKRIEILFNFEIQKRNRSNDKIFFFLFLIIVKKKNL